MTNFTNSEFSAQIKLTISPLTISFEQLSENTEIVLHVYDVTGDRVLNVSGLSARRLRAKSGLRSLIVITTGNLKRRGYL